MSDLQRDFMPVRIARAWERTEILLLTLMSALVLAWQLGLFSHPLVLVFFSGVAVGLAAAQFIVRRNSKRLSVLRAFQVEDEMIGVYRDAHNRRKLRRALGSGVVYVLQDIDVTGWYKIGKTNKPVERIGHFDTKLPFETRLVHVIQSENYHALEAFLHAQFKDKRKRGEWFDLSETDIALIISQGDVLL